MNEEAKPGNTILEFMMTVGRLKKIKRTGWVLKNVNDPETISGHMYRMAILSMLIPETKDEYCISKEKCMKLALVHDMAESIVGDITPACGVSAEEKQKRENDAMLKLKDLAGGTVGQEMYDLWHEYEHQTSKEAVVVKDLDKFDMILQAYEYEQQDSRPSELQEFFDSTKDAFQHPEVKDWVTQLNELRSRANANTKENL